MENKNLKIGDLVKYMWAEKEEDVIQVIVADKITPRKHIHGDVSPKEGFDFVICRANIKEGEFAPFIDANIEYLEKIPVKTYPLKRFIAEIGNYSGEVGRFKMSDGSIRAVGIEKVDHSKDNIKVIPGMYLKELKDMDAEQLDKFNNDPNHFAEINASEISTFYPTGLAEDAIYNAEVK